MIYPTSKCDDIIVNIEQIYPYGHTKFVSFHWVASFRRKNKCLSHHTYPSFFSINLVESIFTTYGPKQAQINHEHFCIQNFERLCKLDFPWVINDGV